jgi:uncharacterized membrane protein
MVIGPSFRFSERCNWLVLVFCVVGIIFGVLLSSVKIGLTINIAVGIVALALRLILGGGVRFKPSAPSPSVLHTDVRAVA